MPVNSSSKTGTITISYDIGKHIFVFFQARALSANNVVQLWYGGVTPTFSVSTGATRTQLGAGRYYVDATTAGTATFKQSGWDNSYSPVVYVRFKINTSLV